MKGYKFVDKYTVKLTTVSPLHIGGLNHEDGEILVDEFTQQPYIQATSITGALRDYAENVLKVKGLFGESRSRKSEDLHESKLTLSDVHFEEDSVKFELRTRVKINPQTGTTDSQNKSGQLLDMEVLSSKAKGSFTIYHFKKQQEEYKEVIEQLLAALNAGAILLGGQLSNGCGKVQVDKVYKASFALMTEQGRKDWAHEEVVNGEDISSEITSLTNQVKSDYYKLVINANFDTPFMVKTSDLNFDMMSKIEGYSDELRTPDVMNMTNGNNEFIIPGSSLKGVMRNRIETISKYLKLDGSLMDAAFEDRSKVYFSDCVVDDAHAHLVTRTHIDKFTGGVTTGALFSEAVLTGKANLEVLVNTRSKYKDEIDNIVWADKEIKQTLALLVYAIRDLSIGAYSIGAEPSVGYGFPTINSLTISKEEDLVVLDFKNKQITKGKELLNSWMNELGGAQ